MKILLIILVVFIVWVMMISTYAIVKILNSFKKDNRKKESELDREWNKWGREDK